MSYQHTPLGANNRRTSSHTHSVPPFGWESGEEHSCIAPLWHCPPPSSPSLLNPAPSGSLPSSEGEIGLFGTALPLCSLPGRLQEAGSAVIHGAGQQRATCPAADAKGRRACRRATLVDRPQCLCSSSPFEEVRQTHSSCFNLNPTHSTGRTSLLLLLWFLFQPQFLLKFYLLLPP